MCACPDMSSVDYIRDAKPMRVLERFAWKTWAVSVSEACLDCMLGGVLLASMQAACTLESVS